MSPQPVTEAQILDALRSVQDPDLHRDIVALGFVKDLQISPAGEVSFKVELTTPACPVKEQLESQARTAALGVPGVKGVKVEMTAQVRAAQPLLGAQGQVAGVKNVIAVSSGKGGVGKSTVAVNLACALQQEGARVGLMDGDIYGPNVPLMLGLDGQPQVQGKKIIPFQIHGLQVISIGSLIPEDQPVIWRGPMVHSAIRQFLQDVLWDDLDYLIVDLPPGTGDAQLSLSQQAHVMGAVIVTTPQDVSVLDVKKAIRMFETVHVPILGVVENMAWFTPPGSTERYEIFGKGGGERIEKEFEIPLLGQLPIHLAVREGGDRGRPVTIDQPDTEVAQAFRKLARDVAARVSTANAEVTA